MKLAISRQLKNEVKYHNSLKWHDYSRLPRETKESTWKTIKFIEKIAPDDVGFYNVATPLPGTPNMVKESWPKVTRL